MKNKLLFLIVTLILSANTFAAETFWSVNAAQSHLYFIFDQAGSDEQGEFEVFSTEINFDPEDLVASKIKVVIDIGSLSTKDSDRDKILLSKEMFDSSKWAKAYFEANKIEHVKGNEYTSQATLKIRDVTKIIVFPLTLDITSSASGKELRLKSDVMIKRLGYGVGQGDWADVTWVADLVKVKVDLVAIKNK